MLQRLLHHQLYIYRAKAGALAERVGHTILYPPTQREFNGRAPPRANTYKNYQRLHTACAVMLLISLLR